MDVRLILALVLGIATALMLTVPAPVRDEFGAPDITRMFADFRARDNGRVSLLDLVPDGVDRVVTAHSEGQIPVYAEIVRPFGQIVAIDDGERDVSPLKAKSIAWHWELMFTRSLFETPDMIEQHHLLQRVSQLVDLGVLRTTLGEHFGTINAANLRRAHALLESGKAKGKIVLEGF